MAEGPFETSKARPGDALLQRRVELHQARRPFSYTAAVSGRDLRMEALNPSSGSHRPAARSGVATTSSAAAAAASGRRSGGGELHQRGVDPELSFEITFRRIGAGLANLGNTCFLNSVLQCLTYTEPFAAYLQSGKHKSSCRTAGFCAMCALQNHVMDALQSTGKILRPFHLVKNLRCISRNFRNSRQEDAHEYMVNLLESMHKCCLPTGIASESPSAYDKSLVHKIFGGRLRSQVKCLQCSYCSNKFDPFLDLSLEIAKADTLHKALSHFTAVEQLDGGEKQYQCQRCKQKVTAVKQLTIHKAPYVLTVHLKRFGSFLPEQKINKKVDFEPTLDLKRYVSDPGEGDLKYTLYGVLVHAGDATHSGHYYCFVRTSSGMWYSLNDDQVFQVSEKTVLQQKAYMLFYVRNIRSYVPRRALDIVCKEKRLANASGNRAVPVCSMDSRRASVDCPREGGPRKAIQDCPGESGSKKHKTDTSCLHVPRPMKDILMKEHLMKKTSISPCLLTEDSQKSTPSEGYILHSLSKVSSIKEPSAAVSLLSSAIGEHLVAEGLMEKVSSSDNCNQLFGEDLVQSALSKKMSVSSLSGGSIELAAAGGKLIVANSLVKVALASTQSSHMKDELTTDSTVEVDKSSILVMHHAKGNAILNPASDNRIGTDSRVEDYDVASSSAQSSHVKDGLTSVSTVDVEKSNIPVMHHAKGNGILHPDPKKVLIEGTIHEEHDAQSMKVQVNGTSCKACSFWEHGQAALSNHSSAIGTEDLRIAQAQCQDATVNDGRSNGPVTAKALENMSKESGQVIPVGSNLSTSCGSQKEGVGYTKSDKIVMKQKVRKHFHMSNMKFGPRRLFLAYLNPVKRNVKRKKHRRIKKQCLNSKGKQIYRTFEDSIQGDQQTSTSIRVDATDVDLALSPKKKACLNVRGGNGITTDADVVCSTKKKCCNSSNRENGICGAENLNSINRGSVNSKDSSCGKRHVKNSTELSLKLEGQHTTRKASTCSKSHHVSRNLSSHSGEVRVARQYDMGSMPEVASISDEPKSMGYMLNEWGKECNKGKKKVKRCRRFFGGGNHFRDMAAVRSQKKTKVDQTSSGNKPFRIPG